MTNPVQNEDAVVVKFTETVSTLALLNIYWLVSALLVVPLFAATEAVFYCMNRYVKDRETRFGHTFFSYVKRNLFSSFKRQVLPVMVLIVAFMDTLVIYFMPIDSVIRSLLLGIFLILTLLVFMLFMYQLVFLFSEDSASKPLKRLKARVVQAYVTVIRYPQYTFTLILILFVYLLISLYFVPMLFFFGLSFPAYCFTYVTLNKLDKKSHRMD